MLLLKSTILQDRAFWVPATKGMGDILGKNKDSSAFFSVVNTFVISASTVPIEQW